jgi:hypothetical protein
MNKSRSGSVFSFVVVLAALVAMPAQAATITVKSNADAGGTCPGPSCTLRQAIATAAPGDTIEFYPGLSVITLTSAELLITKNLTLNGPGANLLRVQRSAAAANHFRIFNVVGNTVTISNLTIASGLVGTDGAGVRHDGGALNITNCAISGNSVDSSVGGFGGGIYNSATSGTLTIANSTISGNTAQDTGGGIVSYGTLTITNSTFTTNSAATAGGIGLGSGTLTITNCTITGNSASDAVGGLDISPGTPTTVRNTIIAQNTCQNFAPDVGGTITSQGYNLIGNNKDATIVAQTGDQIGTPGAPINPMLGPLQDNGGPTKTHALLSGSSAIEKGDSGGSSTDQRGFARPVDSSIIVNVGDGSDIGAYEVQADVLPGCADLNRVVNNNNDSGTDSLRGVIANVCNGTTITFAPNVRGAINLTSGELLLSKSVTITGPGANLLSVQRDAAGSTSNFRIFNIATNVNATISGLTIANGNASTGISAGGGIFNNGTLTVANASISGNSAVTAGGGIANNSATLTLYACTVSGNFAGGGAGISGGTTNVINSTISGNSATGNGGGLTVATLSLTNSTIAGNSAGGSGGGLFNNGANGATVIAKSTIVALNTSPSGPDINGALISQGFNLIGNTSTTTISPAHFTDQVGGSGSPIDPLLGVLQDNGGPTFTRALLPGSPAIDKGDSGGLTTDQRGSSRPIDLAGIVNANGGDGSDIGAFEVNGGVLGNISTRLQVGTGNNVLFAGFIIQGTGSKTLLIRSAGPSLTPFGVPGALANPQLELHDANNTIGTNDNWQTTQIGGVITSDQVAAIQNSGAPPLNSAEPAIIATLPAGSYSAIVQGVGGTQGVATVEVYDLSQNNGSILGNISTRGFIQTGDNVMIGGFIVVGSSSKILVRATGPSLIQFGISNALVNPRLELHDGNGTLAGNDDWQTTQTGGIIGSDQSAAIQASGLAPGNAAESAIIATLAPGNYTAIAQGVDGGTGVGLVEVFALP